MPKNAALLAKDSEKSLWKVYWIGSKISPNCKSVSASAIQTNIQTNMQANGDKAKGVDTQDSQSNN